MRGFELMKFRKELWLKQEFMAHLLGVSRGHYSKLERNRRKISPEVEERFKEIQKAAKKTKFHGTPAYIDISFTLQENEPSFWEIIKTFGRVLWKKL